MPEHLQTELRFFDRLRLTWLREHANDYVVIKGEAALGFFDNFAVAHDAGLRQYGPNEDFLVKKIVEHESAFSLY
jgi:hypothetical protein